MAILIMKIRTACKAHGNNSSKRVFVWIGFYQIMFTLYILVSNGVGVEALINQQSATLSELLCSFLRIGTGLEMEVKFMNPGLRMLLNGSGRQKVQFRYKRLNREWRHKNIARSNRHKLMMLKKV